MKNSEIAILILSTENNKYKKFIDAVHSSWVKKMSELGVICYFYSGGFGEEKITKNKMQLTAPDELRSSSEKLVAAISLLHKIHPDVKLIYRTNLSSYIDPESFLKYIRKNRIGCDSYSGWVGSTTLLRERLYGRWILYYIIRKMGIGRPIQFASGSGFFLGINHALKIMKNKNDLSLVDDVMVGYTLNCHLSSNQSPPRFNIKENSEHKIDKNEFYHLVNELHLFHYRFKTANRDEDAKLLSKFSDPIFRMSICTKK